MKCCVCGQEIVGADPAILFFGKRADEKYLCEGCEKKLEILSTGADIQRKRVLCAFFLERARRCGDLEVKEYLIDMLRSGGYEIPDDKQNDLQSNVAESGWIVLLRFVVWLEIIGGCIGSIVIGVGVGSVTRVEALGAGIAIIGIIVSFILSAAIMIFIDMASDIRYIRNKMK